MTLAKLRAELMEGVRCAKCGMEGLSDDQPRTPCPQCGSTARAFGAEIEETLHAADSVSAIALHRFALVHLHSAASFSRCTKELEDANSGKTWGPFVDPIVAAASAAVMLAVAALEAYANEFFIDNPRLFDDGSGSANAWDAYRPKEIFAKYELALDRSTHERLDRGSRLSQQIKALVELRNAITHFKPEWDSEPIAHAKVSSLLRGKIEASPFVPTNQPLFPIGWQSHSCTAWAVRSVFEFILDFEHRTGVEDRFTKSKEKFANL